MSQGAISTKTSFNKRIINESQIVLHFVVIIGGLVLSWFLHPLVVLLLAVLQKMHLKVFRGCVLTNIHKATGGIAKDKGFWQTVFSRFLNIKISETTARLIDWGWTLSMLTISLVSYFIRLT